MDRRSIHRFLVLRLIVGALVVGAGIMIIQMTNEQFPVRPLYFLLLVSAVTGGIAYAGMAAGLPLRTAVWMVTVADLLLEAGLIHFSGGRASQFSMIYCLSIVAAAYLLEMAGGVATALLASGMFIGYGMLDSWGIIDAPTIDGLPSAGKALGLLETYMHVSIFFLVGSVGGYLAERIKHNRRQLASAESQLEQLRIDTDFIVNNMSSGILVVDADGLVVTANPAAEEILEIEHGQCVLRPLDAALGETAPELAAELLRALREGRNRLRHEVSVRREGRKDLPLGVSVSILRDTDGDRRGVVGVFQDLTEVREMQERVRKADRLAAVGALSAGIAHEIRNPLASISGSIEMLSHELKLDGEDRRLMELVMRESDRLDRIITDFLDFAKLRAPSRRPIDLETCLGEVITLLRNNAAVAGRVDIRLTCPQGLPPARLDDEQMRQVFLNLAINGCESMEKGALEIEVERSGGSRVRIAFRDQGPGIDAHDVERMFEPFFTTKEGGTGLGLAIANKIVSAHGGTIEFANRPEGGAQFVVTLPVGRVDRVAPQNERNEPETATSTEGAAREGRVGASRGSAPTRAGVHAH